MPDESRNYEGLEARLYDEFWVHEEFDDFEFFRTMLLNQGGACLDVGCGTGRLLVPLAKEGVEIEGVDNAPEMLAICREKLEAAGAKATLHEQSMTELDLGKTFETVMVPGASLQILIDRETAQMALSRMREHLAPSGQLLISMFIPWFELMNESSQGKWRLHKQAIREEDDSSVFCHTISELDRHAQIMHVWNRYEVFDAEGELKEAEMREMELRWYFKNEFLLLLEKCGFGDVVTYGDFLDEEAADGHSVITYRARIS